MNGISKGTQSSIANPALQLISRQGGHLVDIYSGSYIIESLIDPTASTATTVVVSTAINTTTHKLSTGRYAILTGATSSWAAGHHRVVITYKLVAGGDDYLQIIPFEVLTAMDWPDGGASYVGYISTFEAFRAGFATYGTDSVRNMHDIINAKSHLLERWTGHQFHPRYKALYLNGDGTNELVTEEPIIAVGSLQWIWHGTQGEEAYTYETYQYRVYNYHLDGEAGNDTRLYSTMEFLFDDGGEPFYNEGRPPWIGSDHRVKVSGVFGYTDVETDYKQTQTKIGQTPKPLAEVVGILLNRSLDDRLLQNPGGAMLGRVKSMRTRDQAISFFGNQDSSNFAGIPVFTGDPLLDIVIYRYCRATNVVFA